jgi:hypothetical protein
MRCRQRQQPVHSLALARLTRRPVVSVCFAVSAAQGSTVQAAVRTTSSSGRKLRRIAEGHADMKVWYTCYRLRNMSRLALVWRSTRVCGLLRWNICCCRCDSCNCTAYDSSGSSSRSNLAVWHEASPLPLSAHFVQAVQVENMVEWLQTALDQPSNAKLRARIARKIAAWRRLGLSLEHAQANHALLASVLGMSSKQACVDHPPCPSTVTVSNCKSVSSCKPCPLPSTLMCYATPSALSHHTCHTCCPSLRPDARTRSSDACARVRTIGQSTVRGRRTPLRS